MKKIAHLTSAHSRYDTRIFLKMCRSLATANYAVTLVVADAKGDEFKDGVSIVDVGVSSGRLKRIFQTTRRVFKKAVELDADIYHIHDPELIPFGLKLKKIGKKVIFDAHEDLPKQLLGKPYLNSPSRWMLSKTATIYENWALKKLDAIVTATPHIRDKFLKINEQSVDVNNFPMLGELAVEKIDWSIKKAHIAYIGGIAEIRGIKQVVNALSFVSCKAQLQLGGKFSEKDIEEKVKKLEGWCKVNQLGFVNREAVRHVLEKSIAGLVTFLPLPNHIDAQPNKMFEYMSAGVPVIASHFPLWKEIVEGNQCGICIDPLDPQAIAEAIDYLVTHPIEAEQMGRNGQKAVQEYYNWAMEESKLLNLYHIFLAKDVV